MANSKIEEFDWLYTLILRAWNIIRSKSTHLTFQHFQLNLKKSFGGK